MLNEVPALVSINGASCKAKQFPKVPLKFVEVAVLVGSTYTDCRFVIVLNIFPINEPSAISLIITLSILWYLITFVCPLHIGVPFGICISKSSQPVVYALVSEGCCMLKAAEVKFTPA